MPLESSKKSFNLHYFLPYNKGEIMSEIKHIEVVPYDPNWPQQFETESAIITKALADNFIAIHHVGSTSISGLSAKPKVDIIAVVKNGAASIHCLQKAGFEYRGEWNIPFKYGFTKRNSIKVNLHVYENEHPEIECNLLFRDYLRTNASARDEYATLKKNILTDDTAFEKKTNTLFAGYTLQKGPFIRKVLRTAGFNRIRMLQCTDNTERGVAKHFRQKYFFSPHNMDDPYTWTFNHPQHKHFVLYQGTEIIGYTHIQLWLNERAAMRIIIIDESKRNRHLGGKFLALCEKWLKGKGYKSIHAKSTPTALAFYRKHGYVDMPFNNPNDHQGGPENIAVGKRL